MLHEKEIIQIICPLIFGISLALTPSSSFSLAAKVLSKLNSCSLMRRLH